ncbi:hypothetical protein KSP40_PGU018467 [Platanthera guangdongensis]|uniref:Uncharacterized protein n=1 Tax=Platanthera guangdongensis TaxID=2320717 RepID=A0ABR2MTR4_9ASPA
MTLIQGSDCQSLVVGMECAKYVSVADGALENLIGITSGEVVVPCTGDCRSKKITKYVRSSQEVGARERTLEVGVRAYMSRQLGNLLRLEKNSSRERTMGQSGNVSALVSVLVRGLGEEDEAQGMGCWVAGLVGRTLDGWMKEAQDSSWTEDGFLGKIWGETWSEGRGRSLLDNNLTTYKEFKNSNVSEDHSHHKMELTNNPFCPEKETEELEEGQLVEEPDDYQISEINFNSDGRPPASTAKMDSIDPGQKNKMVERYDQNHLLETLAKMEKRRQRFKDPIPLKKENENCRDLRPDSSVKGDIKQQRPSRKRRWCNSQQ